MLFQQNRDATTTRRLNYRRAIVLTVGVVGIGIAVTVWLLRKARPTRVVSYAGLSRSMSTDRRTSHVALPTRYLLFVDRRSSVQIRVSPPLPHT